MPGDERFAVDRLKRFCAEVFVACGVGAGDAAVSADVLVSADARGIPSHGIARLGRYVNGLRTGLMLGGGAHGGCFEVVRESPVSMLVDAKGSLGAPVSKFAMDSVIEKAGVSGMAFACVRNSNHFGIAGYYAMMALERDMIGICMTNTAALGVPTFGRDAMFGTNPLAFAAPAEKEKAFVLDMSTTVVTRGKLEVYDRLGKDLPAGWAVGKNGATAVKPGPLLDDMQYRRGGGIVPLGGEGEEFGGHKGFGLAVMVDIMTGVLSGSQSGAEIFDSETSSARVSHCFGAMKTDLFQDPADFKRHMDRMLHALRTAERAEGTDRVYYAGLKEFEAEELAARDGIALPEKVVNGLRGTGAEMGIGL